MAKIPDQPQEVFVPLTSDYQKIFGGDLVSLIVYGSAAAGSYVKGKSDINLLVVLTEAGKDRLDAAFDKVKYWKKRGVTTPLVMTREFIETSLDSYPIEFLNMKNSHILVYGENVLANLEFQPADLRLQIEREIKGKIILLTQGYLETEGSARQLRQLIGNSFTAFISIFNALLFLKQGKAPKIRRETIQEACNLFSLDTAVFEVCSNIKEGKDKLASKEIITIFKKYLKEVEKIGNIVDQL
jgi:predicted nucleotidyltransferase